MLEDQVDGEDVHVLENPTDPDSSSHRQISERIIVRYLSALSGSNV